MPSNHSVDETVKKLKGILQAKGITLFALVDHSGEAAKAGMKMRPTKLFITPRPPANSAAPRKIVNALLIPMDLLRPSGSWKCFHPPVTNTIPTMMRKRRSETSVKRANCENIMR